MKDTFKEDKKQQSVSPNRSTSLQSFIPLQDMREPEQQWRDTPHFSNQQDERSYSPFRRYREAGKLNIDGTPFLKERSGSLRSDAYKQLKKDIYGKGTQTDQEILDAYNNNIGGLLNNVNLYTHDNAGQGEKQKGARGWYNPKTKSLNANLYNLKAEYPISTFNHELTHAANHLDREAGTDGLEQDLINMAQGSRSSMQTAIDKAAFPKKYPINNLKLQGVESGSPPWPADEYNGYMVQNISKGIKKTNDQQVDNALKGMLQRNVNRFNRYNQNNNGAYKTINSTFQQQLDKFYNDNEINQQPNTSSLNELKFLNQKIQTNQQQPIENLRSMIGQQQNPYSTNQQNYGMIIPQQQSPLSIFGGMNNLSSNNTPINKFNTNLNSYKDHRGNYQGSINSSSNQQDFQPILGREFIDSPYFQQNSQQQQNPPGFGSQYGQPQNQFEQNRKFAGGGHVTNHAAESRRHFNNLRMIREYLDQIYQTEPLNRSEHYNSQKAPKHFVKSDHASDRQQYLNNLRKLREHLNRR